MFYLLRARTLMQPVDNPVDNPVGNSGEAST